MIPKLDIETGKEPGIYIGIYCHIGTLFKTGSMIVVINEKITHNLNIVDLQVMRWAGKVVSNKNIQHSSIVC